MPKNHRTTKTEFARFLNDGHHFVAEQAKPYLAEYRSTSRRKDQFGNWLYAKHHKVFDKLFKSFWKEHPELWGVVYEDSDPDRFDPLL